MPQWRPPPTSRPARFPGLGRLRAAPRPRRRRGNPPRPADRHPLIGHPGGFGPCQVWLRCGACGAAATGWVGAARACARSPAWRLMLRSRTLPPRYWPRFSSPCGVTQGCPQLFVVSADSAIELIPSRRYHILWPYREGSPQDGVERGYYSAPEDILVGRSFNGGNRTPSWRFEECDRRQGPSVGARRPPIAYSAGAAARAAVLFPSRWHHLATVGEHGRAGATGSDVGSRTGGRDSGGAATAPGSSRGTRPASPAGARPSASLWTCHHLLLADRRTGHQEFPFLRLPV